MRVTGLEPVASKLGITFSTLLSNKIFLVCSGKWEKIKSNSRLWGISFLNLSTLKYDLIVVGYVGKG